MSSAALGRPSSTLPQKVLEKVSERRGSAALTWESAAHLGPATTESEDIMNTQHQQWSEEFEERALERSG